MNKSIPFEALPYTCDVKKVANYLSVSPQTIKRRIVAGELKAYKDGGYWKIKREWLKEYEDRLIDSSILKAR